MQYLIKALVLPLLALTIAAMLASVYVREPWSGLLVNLAASFVGAIITVGYIDVVVRRHERKQWVAVKARVEKHVERIANVCVHSIRGALGLERGGLEVQGVRIHKSRRVSRRTTRAMPTALRGHAVRILMLKSHGHSEQ